MSYYAKVHLYDSEKIIAVCDGPLLGKSIPHNGIKLNILPRFYGELEYFEDEILKEIKTSTQINAIGKNICQLLIDHGYVHPDTIMWMKHEDMDIGHVIVVR